MKRALLILCLVLGPTTACKQKTTGSADAASIAAAAKLTDLSGSLDAARVAFNARKQEARFLTLLSPA